MPGPTDDQRVDPPSDDATGPVPAPSAVSALRRGSAVEVRIDRPTTRNAISTSVMGELELVLDQLESDPPAVVVVRGGGERVFVSGGDLKELARLRTVADANGMAIRMRRVLDRLASLPSAVIAVIN